MTRQRTPADQTPAILAALEALPVEMLRDLLAHETQPALAWLERVAIARKERAA